jgi:hypothetical protein
VFHPKLCLLVAERRARAVISSANLTRGGFERQRELGRVYDLGPESVDQGLFGALVEYLRDGVSTEVRGASSRDLEEITGALQDLVKGQKSRSATTPHVLLHNYAQPIWSQVLDRIPHRVLRRAVIVSPFFEPDREHPEDPAVGPQDASIFRRLFEDFEFDAPNDEAPVRVFFRQREGRTELPVCKLRELSDRVAFFAQDEREQQLHAKLVLLEGAGREPFLIALHGSPNFTTAGLLNRPPHGNSELAVLTTLPVAREGLTHSLSVLGLDRSFLQVKDLEALTTEERGGPPAPPSQGVADAMFRVAEGVVHISLLQATPDGGRIRILLLRDGLWVSIGEAAASRVTDVLVPVHGLAETDERTKLRALRGTTVRVEVLAPDGTVVTSGDSPINVDAPQEFCGLTLVGSAVLTLDERIARAGIGVWLSYREQQKWLEAREAQHATTGDLPVSRHQADLDRFYRNIHQGLRGILARCKASSGSEFSMRRTLDELSRWSLEASSRRDPSESLPVGGATRADADLTPECRLFLVDRLLSGMQSVIGGASAPVRDRVPAIASDLGIADRVAQVAAWLESLGEPALATYATRSLDHARHIGNALTTRGGR